MIHRAQGVQMTNHPRVFTRSRWLQQGITTKTETFIQIFSCVT